MMKFLNTSFKLDSNTRKTLSQAIWSSVCAFFFILFFQPFGLPEVRLTETLFLVAGMGLIVFSAFVVFLIIIPRAFAKWFLASDWEDSPPDLLNLIMWIVSATAMAFYVRFVAQTPLSIPLVVRVVLICLMPSVYVRVDMRMVALRRRVEAGKTSPIHEEPSPVQEFEIRADNGLDGVKMRLDRLLAIKSADNYIEVRFRDGDEIQSKLIRTTLKKASQDLAGFPSILQCHRAYIVNLANVERLRRSASGYVLELRNQNVRIPVSRAYQIRVRETLEGIGDR